ncbi:MAG: glycosyltransferase family 4 protein [Nitrospinae bacterium]|nr:glycosyltransferase family 4 protein [Nitrospinota bacterium]
MKLRIAFDGRVISKGKTGIGVYAENLLKALKEVDKNNLYEVFSNDSFPLESPRFKSVITKFSLEDHPAGDIWEQFYLPVYLNKKGIDVFHSPTFHIPFFLKGFKKVVTIHDLVSFHYPETLSKKFSVYCRFMIKRAVNSVDAIIVPSFFVKSELVDLLNVDERLIYVIPYAQREIFRNINDYVVKSEIKNRYGLTDNFILFIGTIEPRKNISGLIRAYSILRKKDSIRQKLVICGSDGWLNEKKRILKIIGEAGFKRVKQFSWEKAALETVKVYWDVYKGRKNP